MTPSIQCWSSAVVEASGGEAGTGGRRSRRSPPCAALGRLPDPTGRGRRAFFDRQYRHSGLVISGSPISSRSTPGVSAGDADRAMAQTSLSKTPAGSEQTRRHGPLLPGPGRRATYVTGSPSQVEPSDPIHIKPTGIRIAASLCPCGRGPEIASGRHDRPSNDVQAASFPSERYASIRSPLPRRVPFGLRPLPASAAEPDSEWRKPRERLPGPAVERRPPQFASRCRGDASLSNDPCRADHESAGTGSVPGSDPTGSESSGRKPSVTSSDDRPTTFVPRP